MSIVKEKKMMIIEHFDLSVKDTGSVYIQVMLMTDKIKNLTQHMGVHKKDFSSKRGLLILVARRRKFLNFIKKRCVNNYLWLLSTLGLKTSFAKK